MEPVTFMVNAEGFIAFDAPFVYELCGHLRTLIEESHLLPPVAAAAAPSSQTADEPQSLPFRFQRPGPPMQSAPTHADAQPDSANPPQTSPNKRALPSSSSSGSARPLKGIPGLGIAANAEAVETKRRTNTGATALIVDTLRKLGEADISGILEELEACGKELAGDDPVKTVSAALYYQQSRGGVERVEGTRGFWRVAA